MEEKKENQRVRITKKMLKDALVDLLLERTLQKVTITEICTRAQINRTTFYKYYANECELYADIENDFIQVLSKNMENSGQESIEKLLTLIHLHERSALVMINNSSQEKLSQRIFSLPQIRREIHLRKLDKNEYSEEILFFIFSGAYSVIQRWINNGFVHTPKEMAVFLNRTIDKMVK